MGLARLLRRSWFLPRVSTDRLEALERGPGAARRFARPTKRCVRIERAGRQIASGKLTSDLEDER